MQLIIIWLFFKVREVCMNGIELDREYQREVEVTSYFGGGRGSQIYIETLL